MRLIVMLTLVLGMLRVVLPVSGGINRADIYKDLAHLWVGALFGAACAATYYAKKFDGHFLPIAAKLWFLAIALTGLEIVAFLFLKP